MKQNKIPAGIPYYLSEDEKLSIIKDMLKGRSVYATARRHGLPSGAVKRYRIIWEPYNYHVDKNTGMGCKNIPYYETEMEYAPRLKYTLRDLSLDEIDIYLKDN